MHPTNPTYHQLIANIGVLLQKGKEEAVNAINRVLVQTYWEIGKFIIEYEQAGQQRAEYGTALLDQLSKDLSQHYGKGFGRSNLIYIRKFYLTYPNSELLSTQLTWSHYFELLKIEDELERSFYEQQITHEKWSVRELKRQLKSALFLRLAKSRDKKGILELAKKGRIVTKASDVVKDPYILDFLDIPEDYRYTESELELRLIDNLQDFLMELGKGFAFVGRQYRITINNKHYYVDLVFYHRILKCFVLLDLKINEVEHYDIGQMNMYLNYFKKEENVADDHEPIGIILGAKKDDVLVEYATGGMTNQLFVSKYQLFLPDRKQLEEQVKQILATNGH